MVWLKVALELTYPITSNDMKQEDIQKVLEVLGKGGINVAGDFVVSKHVEYEVNNVETGGIGIQIVNGKEEQKNDVSQPQGLDEQLQEVVDRLKPIFFGIEDDAREFLVSIQGMKPTQITDKVKQLVSENKISDLSKRRDLWKVLHDYGLYDKSESNWNQQVK